MSLFDLQKVVVPVDFSEESFAAVDVALEVVDGNAGKVYLIHVLPELSPADPGVVWGEVSDENRARHVRDALLKRLPSASSAEMHIEVVVGNPGLLIADYSAGIEADLIIIPSHGRTGLQRLLIGSVAQRVIQHAHCPVLVLRNSRN
jgi:nucleotide-binding universal stress UspA family protein